jgi:hypothetical protein
MRTMTPRRLLAAMVACTALLVGIGALVDSPVETPVLPAAEAAVAAGNYQVTCWSTTGSPYVSTSAVSFSPTQAMINCISGLISRRWGASNCGGAFFSFSSGGYHYGYAQEYPNRTWCNYSRGSTFNAKGYTSGYW